MSKKNENNSCPFSDRLGKVGGQAVLEGVMMKAGKRMVTTCRKDDGTLVVNDDNFTSVRDKNKILDLPIIRGVVSFIESMIMSFKTLGASADALGLEEEEPSKFEKWLSEKLHVKTTDFVMVVSLILGLGLSLLLFMYLPIGITAGVTYLLEDVFDLYIPRMTKAIYEGVLEGAVKMAIFIGYLVGVSFMPDIKRTFMYHGAEHKSIACFEAGEELTPENAKHHTRFHPRCGTSFMFFMILLGVFAGLILKIFIETRWIYTLVRLLVLPILMGLGYEFIRYAGKHPSALTRALSAPGLWMQKITTKEPTEDMLEVAITSLKCALRDDYPEFMEFYEAKPWVSEENQLSVDVSEANVQKQGAGDAECIEAEDATMFQKAGEEEATAENTEESTGEAVTEKAENDI